MNKNIAEAQALQFYLDAGVDEVLDEAPVDRYAANAAPVSMPAQRPPQQNNPQVTGFADQAKAESFVPAPAAANLLGASDARNAAAQLAAEVKTLDDLKTAVNEFEGIALKGTAMNIVFGDGNPKADIMIIGEAPGTDDDRQGVPFVGVSGQLLDKILACINLSRGAETSQEAVYISNVLNWRPPGNRSPSPAEIEVSLPFIERHIQLAQPKLLLFSGGVAAKALLQSSNSISRLRKRWHDYETHTPELKADSVKIPALATFHPSYLLRTPSQKRAAWADMLMLQEKLNS